MLFDAGCNNITLPLPNDNSLDELLKQFSDSSKYKFSITTSKRVGSNNINLNITGEIFQIELATDIFEKRPGNEIKVNRLRFHLCWEDAVALWKKKSIDYADGSSYKILADYIGTEQNANNSDRRTCALIGQELFNSMQSTYIQYSSGQYSFSVFLKCTQGQSVSLDNAFISQTM